MPALDYQDIICAKGLPFYEDLLRHKEEFPSSSLVQIWMQATGMETLDYFIVKPVQKQEVNCTITKSSNEGGTSPGIFSMLPRRMSLFVAMAFVCMIQQACLQTNCRMAHQRTVWSYTLRADWPSMMMTLMTTLLMMRPQYHDFLGFMLHANTSMKCSVVVCYVWQ